ncbi:MAG: (2Fe-2S)-binding protein [Holophagales bacterium]|nr:(2Fe-2S)-binding protein [Holophagales bacterium]
MQYQLNVNGRRHEVEVDPDTPLLWVLRDELRLTGTKFGCGIAQCGACTVHVDGNTARSCVLPVKWVGERQVTTIEGLDGPAAEAVQESWQQLDVPQCGFCQSGQVMTAAALIARIPRPTDDDIDAAMNGNVCRCATYVGIREAVHRAAGNAGEADRG